MCMISNKRVCNKHTPYVSQLAYILYVTSVASIGYFFRDLLQWAGQEMYWVL